MGAARNVLDGVKWKGGGAHPKEREEREKALLARGGGTLQGPPGLSGMLRNALEGNACGGLSRGS